MRRTARRTGYPSDASLRFSQGFPAELIDYTTHQVAEVFGQYGSIVASYDCQRASLAQQRSAAISTNGVNALLGTKYTQEVVAETLTRLGFTHKYHDQQKQFVISVPVERPDIQDEHDLIEEVGRILGYDTVPSVAPTTNLWTRIQHWLSLSSTRGDKMFAKRLVVLQALQKIGFSEVMTSSFCTKGEVCVAYPVAKDKGCLRSSLRPGIEEALKQNAYNGELLGLDTVRIAEIGSVFTEKGEMVHLALGVQETLGRKKVDTTTIEKEIQQVLGISSGFKNGVWEVPLEKVQVYGFGNTMHLLGRYSTHHHQNIHLCYGMWQCLCQTAPTQQLLRNYYKNTAEPSCDKSTSLTHSKKTANNHTHFALYFNQTPKHLTTNTVNTQNNYDGHTYMSIQF